MVLKAFATNVKLRRNYGALRKATREGMTLIRMQSIIKSTDPKGEGIHNQDLVDFRKAIIKQDKDFVRLKFLPRKARPNVSRLPTAITNIRRKFSFNVRITGTQNGTPVGHNVTVSTDINLSRDEAEQEAFNSLEITEGDSGYMREWLDVEVQLQFGLKRWDV